ncbi:MAG: hypothetical protein EP330_13230 [Deltaproteobacteria bacterium]|nr:MAG: hypothetical protein EP330_13230 [Deltaproteobacteria bacterium]
MSKEWYVLCVTDADETLLRCDEQGFEPIALRPPEVVSDNPRVARRPVPATTPGVHSPFAPTDVGRMQDGAEPRATHTVDDLATAEDPTERYLRRLGHSVNEAVRARPAPLYVAMDPDRQALFRTVGRTEVEGFFDDPSAPDQTLWKASRRLEA